MSSLHNVETSHHLGPKPSVALGMMRAPGPLKTMSCTSLMTHLIDESYCQACTLWIREKPCLEIELASALQA